MSMQGVRQESGFSYVEVLISVVLIGILLFPAMDALRIGIDSVDHQTRLQNQRERVQNIMETLMAESFNNLLTAAEDAGDAYTISDTYSEPSGTEDRVVVYLGLYDPTNTSDPLIVIDLDLDLDGNSFTGDSADMLWLKVAVENSQTIFLEALRLR